MPTYYIQLHTTYEKEVEAESLDDAIDAAVDWACCSVTDSDKWTTGRIVDITDEDNIIVIQER